ncbi:hypothetical protein EES40_36270 [Streptomyces sp. ADI93-02]|nr:hypothetical protein EES40_36270 [Streptomyces sp. ADI93-02]
MRSIRLTITIRSSWRVAQYGDRGRWSPAARRELPWPRCRRSHRLCPSIRSCCDVDVRERRRISVSGIGRVQAVVATPGCCNERSCSSKTSAGVRRPRIFQGRLLIAMTTASRSAEDQRERSVPSGSTDAAGGSFGHRLAGRASLVEEVSVAELRVIVVSVEQSLRPVCLGEFGVGGRCGQPPVVGLAASSPTSGYIMLAAGSGSPVADTPQPCAAAAPPGSPPSSEPSSPTTSPPEQDKRAQ